VKTIRDEDILFDLEFRGIDDFISEMESGFFVPSPFVKRIKRIIKREYGINLIESGKETDIDSGCFCLMEYKNQKQIQLIKEQF